MSAVGHTGAGRDDDSDEMDRDRRRRAIHLAEPPGHPRTDLAAVEIDEPDCEQVVAIYDTSNEEAWVESTLQLNSEEIR